MMEEMIAEKACVAPVGIHRNVNVAESDTPHSGKRTMMESKSLSNATSVEKAVMCGLTEEEAKRIERHRSDCEKGLNCCGTYNDEFYLYIIDKLIEKFRPKYTYQEIIDMHRHLG